MMKKQQKVIVGAVLAFMMAAATGCSGGTDILTPTDRTAPYSDTLKAVVSDSTYSASIAAYDGNPNKPDYYAFPYTFCSARGFSESEIRNGTTQAQCVMTLSGNTLSMYITLSPSSPKSYTCYAVEYTLTAEEREELVFLYKGNYIEAPFYVRTVSRRKQPTAVAEYRLSESLYLATVQAVQDYYSEDGLQIAISDLGTDTLTCYAYRTSPEQYGTYDFYRTELFSEEAFPSQLEKEYGGDPEVVNGVKEQSTILSSVFQRFERKFS